MSKNGSGSLQYFSSNLCYRLDVPLHLLHQLHNYCLLQGETQLRPDRLEARVFFQERRPKNLGINKLTSKFIPHTGIALLEAVANS